MYIYGSCISSTCSSSSNNNNVNAIFHHNTGSAEYRVFNKFCRYFNLIPQRRVKLIKKSLHVVH